MIPWQLIGTIVVGIVKWVFDKQAKKKLSNAEFIAHIEAHQKRRQNAGQAAKDFDTALEEARKKLREENNG